MRVPTAKHVARSLGAILLASAFAASANALSIYEIVTLGFTDPEHTRNDGYQQSFVGGPTESGSVYGVSRRYNGGAVLLGQSAWLYDSSDASTTRLGYMDAAHTQSDGTQFSEFAGTVESGFVAGHSRRYVGSSTRGWSAWLYDPSDASTTRVGFFDAGYVAPNGNQSSGVSHLGESGYAAGFSTRYMPNNSAAGGASWFYDPSDGSTTRVGFFDLAHTRNDGFQNSPLVHFSDSGFAAGTAAIYNNGSTALGSSAWLYDASDRTNTRLGYYDTTHTGAAGEHESRVEALSNSGYAIGSSQRFGLPLSLGHAAQSAWLHDANDHSTTRLGYVDAPHTRTDGFQLSTPLYLNDSGHVAGVSERFNGSASHGQSAWLYDVNDDTLTRIGYTDAVHTRSDGFQSSHIGITNAIVYLGTESGLVAGSSNRYNGATEFGSSAWIYDANDDSTTRVGLLDANHTRSDGFQESSASLLTESGFAAGFSQRFSGGSGASAWHYDPNTGTSTLVGFTDATHNSSVAGLLTDSGFLTGSSYSPDGMGGTVGGTITWIYDPTERSQVSIILSARSDGQSFTSVSFLGEDGLALGSYRLFDNDIDLGPRAFAWTPDDGALDLGALVAGGLTAEGWQHLASAVRANGLGMIVGSGLLQSGGELGYLLIPLPVPEPGTGLLVATGLVALTLRSKQRS